MVGDSCLLRIVLSCIAEFFSRHPKLGAVGVEDKKAHSVNLVRALP